VVFESDADNLVTGDPSDGIEKLYVIDLSTGTTTLVSTPTTGPSNSDVSDPVISGDGRVVAFMSAANDFGFTDSNNALDVFAVALPVANDAPVATTPVAHYAATEQTNLSLKNTGMSVSDADANGASETVTLSASEGTLTLVAGTSGAVIDSGNGTGSVTFHGTIAQINALLNTDATSSVSYVDNSDNPAASALLTLSIDDDGNTGTGGPLTASATSTVDITAVNDAPVALIATNPYHVAPNTVLDLKHSGMSVSDVDGNNGAETVILSVTEGTLTLAAGTSGAVIDSGNGTGSVTFHGTIAQLDALLNTDGTSAVSYIDTSAHPAASVQLSLSINDGGHTGTPGPLTDTAISVITDGFANSAPGAFDFNFDNNGNGHADLLLQNGTSGAVSIWESGLPSGNSLVASSVPGWHLDGIGDFDGNGKADILWESDSGSVAIWDNGVTGHTIATGMPSSWHLVGTGDFDGNGKSDILWQNDTGAVAIWDNGQIGHTVAGSGSMLQPMSVSSPLGTSMVMARPTFSGRTPPTARSRSGITGSPRARPRSPRRCPAAGMWRASATSTATAKVTFSGRTTTARSRSGTTVRSCTPSLRGCRAAGTWPASAISMAMGRVTSSGTTTVARSRSGITARSGTRSPVRARLCLTGISLPEE
jgi:hypothetical protein